MHNLDVFEHATDGDAARLEDFAQFQSLHADFRQFGHDCLPMLLSVLTAQIRGQFTSRGRHGAVLAKLGNRS